MKTFEQQLRDYVEWRASQAYPSSIEKQCILQNGAELLLPMVVEMFGALKFECGDRCAWQNPCNAKDASESIQKKIEVRDEN